MDNNYSFLDNASILVKRSNNETITFSEFNQYKIDSGQNCADIKPHLLDDDAENGNIASS